MKNHLIAIALVGASGLSTAQSSVTLFGWVDATVARGSGSVANKTQLTNSGYQASRFGIRGEEDLGGGMSASFWLEMGMANDDGSGQGTNTNNQVSGAGANGALSFNRRSTVSLAGRWGELRLGRDYTPQFPNLNVFDPFITNGVGTNQNLKSTIGGPVSIRASNSIGYLLPSNLGGFYGQVMYYLGENASNSANKNDGTGAGVRIGYASGPLEAAMGLGHTKYLAGDISQNNVGVRWAVGPAKLMALYEWDENEGLTGGSAKAKGFLLGTVVSFGPDDFRIAYSRYRITQAIATPTSGKWAIGYVHNLSKRTAAYATYAHLNNSGGASQALNGAITAPNASSSGFDIGLRHIF